MLKLVQTLEREKTMYKRSERLKEQDEKMKKLVRRNWLIAAVSLILAVLAALFADSLVQLIVDS